MKLFFNFILLFSLLSSSLFSLTLQESVAEVMSTNPIVSERLRNYRATQQDLSVAESEYYPSVDFRASLGYNNGGSIKDSNNGSWNHQAVDSQYNNYETSLILTQNLFEGFSTMSKVDYQEARILAAAYNYVEKSNDIAFQMTNAYLNVVRSYELLQTARENVQINEDIYNNVKDLFDSGLTTDSEVKKIESALSLARSNLTVQKNNSRDTEYTFRRVLGRMPNVAQMSRPELNISMPDNIEKAALYAINHNPSLLVSRYNIKGAQALHKQTQKDFYPKLDLELAQNFNDHSLDKQINGYNQVDDRFSARLVLSYNLFRGGADSAAAQREISKINQEIEIKRDLKRQVIEGLDLSWNAYEMIALQLKDLKDYSKFSEKTLDLYNEEYDLGRRSLLDLLTAQNDVINSRAQIITAEYEHLLAQYRILDAMGLLPMAIVGDTQEFNSKVNLYTDGAAHEILDSIPVKLDVDADNIVDNQDLCDNSLLENNIMPYGCKKMLRDSDGDGVRDSRDKCPNTPKNAKVSPDGCALDGDMDGVKDYKDKCLDTPIGYEVNGDGCAISLNLGVNFKYFSAIIEENSKKNIEKFADFIKKNSNYELNIVGHTSSKGDEDLNKILSQKRAKAVKLALIEMGVNSDSMTTEGRGEEDPLVEDSSSIDGKLLNRRVEIEITID